MPNSFWDEDVILETPASNMPIQKSEPIKNNNSFWGDDAIIENNGTVQSNIVSQPRVTSQPKSIPAVAQSPVNIEPTPQPVYANNGVVQGGTSQNTYLDADGKVHFEGEDDNQIDGLDKFKNVLKAKATNVDEWLNRSAFDPNVQKQKMDAILAMETMPFTFGKLGAWGVSQLTKTPVVGKIAKPIFDVGGKLLNRLPNPLKQIPSLASEGAMWGAFDHGAHKMAGFDNENTLGQDMATGAIAMPALAGGFHLGGKAIKAIAKTKPVKAIANAYNNLLNSETPLGNTIANAQGTLADTLGLDAVNETARKYQKLNRNISRGNTALEKRFNKTDIDEVNNATGLSEEQEKLVFDRLKNGDPKKSTVTKDQEEAKEFFDNLLKEEKVSEHAEGDLSHVKSKTDVVNPKQKEPPLKNDASHVSDDNDRFKIKISDDNISEDNFFKKRTKPITREEALANASKNAGHPVTEFIPDEHAPQFKRSVYGGRVHVEKDGKPWIAYSKKKKLPSGSAEGSDAGNWYVQKTKPKTKGLEADDAYIKPDENGTYVKEAQGQNYEDYVNENYVHNYIAPEDAASLQKEIDNFNSKQNKKQNKNVELKDDKQASDYINKNSEKYLGVNGLLYRGLDKKLTNALKSPGRIIYVKKFVEQLCKMPQSKQTSRAIRAIYENAPDNLKAYIKNQLKKHQFNIDMVSIEQETLLARKKAREANKRKKINNKKLLSLDEKNNTKTYNLDEFFNREKYTKIELKKDAIWNEKFRDYRVHRRKQEFVKKYKKEIEQIYKHKENGMALTNDLKNIKLGLQARQNAVDIFKPKHYAQKDLDYANLIKGQNVDNLNIIISDNKNMIDGALGFFDKNTNDIIIYRGERTNKEISETIWHETQHAMDIIKIRNLPDNHPAKIFYENNQKEYSKVAKYLTDKRLKTYRTYVVDYLKRRNLEKLLPLKKNDIIDNLEKYGKMLKEEVNNGKISKDIADFLSKEADALQRYYNDFFEIRAYNAQNKIKNGDIIDELGRHNQENRSGDVQHIRYSGDNEPRHFGLRPIRPQGNSSHSGQSIRTNERKRTDGNFEINEDTNGQTQSSKQNRSKNDELEWNELAERFDNSIFGRSEGKATQELHTQRPTNSSMSFRQLEEPINQSGEQRLAPTPQSFIKSIRNSSKHQEQIKIDFDIITQDQATNRLKQQAKDGEGIYFKQGFGKANDKIDLTRNYNESRENKVGPFGEKALEGLGKHGSTKDILVETKKEEIKLQHLKDSVDFIESEFAKPIPASGKVSEGYVAVNRNLLANAVYGNKSTAWYEMMERGEEAIKKAFKNEKVAKNWIELANRNSKPDYQLPKQVFNKLFDGSGETVAEYWERYGKDHTGKAMLKTAGAILDAFNNSFKRGVLTSSSFVFNNRFGNQMMIMAKSNPVEYIKSYYQATKLRNDDLPAEVIESSLLEAVEGYNARQTYTGWQPLDNFLNLCGGHTIDTSTLKTMKATPDNGLHFKVIKGKTVPKKMIQTHNAKSLSAEALNICIGLPNKTFNKICDKLMRLNEAMERFERRQVYGIEMNRIKKDLVKKTGQSMISQEAFLNHIKEHPELEETMVKFIEDTLGDYNNFNKFEKKVLKRVVPFYSWYRTITRHTLTLAKENPARCAMIFLELERLKEKDADLKEWQKGSIRTGVVDSRSHKELVANKTAQIPYSTFKEFVDESGKGGLSPAIKKPMEALRGKQFFNDSEITSRRYMKHKKLVDGKKVEGYLDKKTGEFKEGSLPLSPRLNYLGKEALETIYPIMHSPLIKPEATIQGLGNLITNGEYKEPDKLYDADLGGYNKGDKFIGKNKRYASNDTSTATKMINRFVGLSLQNKQPLSKAEKDALKEKYKRQYKRMYN